MGETARRVMTTTLGTYRVRWHPGEGWDPWPIRVVEMTGWWPSINRTLHDDRIDRKAGQPPINAPTLRHEGTHIYQVRMFGVFYLPLYVLCFGWIWMEKQAHAKEQPTVRDFAGAAYPQFEENV
jgi:hypothetical protein